jgi:transposase
MARRLWWVVSRDSLRFPSAIEGSSRLASDVAVAGVVSHRPGDRPHQHGGPSMRPESSAVAIGIDAAVVANHRVAIRGAVVEDFGVPTTLAGLARLTERLTPHAGALAVAEATAMSWLSLDVAVRNSGCELALVEARHSARLRSAVAGRNKTDVIDAEMLATCAGLFGLRPSVLPQANQLALRRAVARRHRGVVEAHGADCRLWSLANWAFPDVWRAAKGSHALMAALLEQWPHLESLARARTASIAKVCATHLRAPDATGRAEQIRRAAAGWMAFWRGRVDLDALAWETVELLGDMERAEAKIARAGVQATACWQAGWGDDELLRSVPGVGPIVAATVRAWFDQPAQFPTAKHAAAFVGLNPSNWESGLMASPSRPLTKEGPPELRLAFYQAANIARRHDPQLAAFYWRLMVERRHNHVKATCAVARKLVGRVWATLASGGPYELRDVDGTPIDRDTATLVASGWAVPDDVRRRALARSAACKRGRLSR